MLASQEAVADDRVLVYPDQAAGLADAAALGDVGKDGHHLLLGQAGVEQRGAFALRKACLAGLAVEQAPLLAAVAHADGEVALAPLPLVEAVAILAAETRQVIRVHRSLRWIGKVVSSMQLL